MVAHPTASPLGSTVSPMRVLLNVIWLVLAGFWAFVGWLIAAVVMFILIITIPFGVQAVKIALFSLWPFGRTLVRRPTAGVASSIGNVVWFLLAGWWLALLHLITGVALAITIIGIPLALGNFKLIPVSLRPFGREIVPLDQARAEAGGGGGRPPPPPPPRRPPGLGRRPPRPGPASARPRPRRWRPRRSRPRPAR